MKINIEIERGEEYGQDNEAGKKLKAIFKKLIDTAFPVGIMHSVPGEKQNNLHFVGTIEDFINAIDIKDTWVKGGRVIEGKKIKNAKLQPIYEKSQAECVNVN